MLSQEDRDEFKQLVNEVLDTRSRIDQVTHKDHHKFIAMLQQEREDRHAMWEKVKGNVVGWFIIIVLGGVGTAVYQFLFEHR